MAWPSDLRSLQERFFALVTSADGVQEGLVRLRSTQADLASLVAGDDRLDGVGRVEVYADMYFDRLRDILEMDFPKLRAVVGEEPFTTLAGDLLEACPPAGFSLRDLGAPLSRLVGANPGLADRPWLADLAALEWGRVDVFDAPDGLARTLDELRTLAPDSFAELPLLAVPAHRVIPVAFAVEEAWRQIDGGGTAEAPAAAPGHLLVWRKHTQVLHRRLPPAEAELLPELAAGTRFGLLCDRLGVGRTVEEAAELAFRFLVAWADHGLLVRPPNELK